VGGFSSGSPRGRELRRRSEVSGASPVKEQKEEREEEEEEEQEEEEGGRKSEGRGEREQAREERAPFFTDTMKREVTSLPARIPPK